VHDRNYSIEAELFEAVPHGRLRGFSCESVSPKSFREPIPDFDLLSVIQKLQPAEAKKGTACLFDCRTQREPVFIMVVDNASQPFRRLLFRLGLAIADVTHNLTVGIQCREVIEIAAYK
jgi:hypothetical protein